MAENSITREYKCNVCNKMHRVELSKDLLEGRDYFPFAHAYLHGDLKDILTLLYLDKDLDIRGAEAQQLDLDNLFAKEQTICIAGNLVDEIERLREENEKLSQELNELKKKVKSPVS